MNIERFYLVQGLIAYTIGVAVPKGYIAIILAVIIPIIVALTFFKEEFHFCMKEQRLLYSGVLAACYIFGLTVITYL